MTDQLLEILSPQEIQPGDLEIIVPATRDQPGQVRLGLALIGKPHPAAPNSVPLISHSGAKIGFVAKADLMEPPYTATYRIEQENSQRPGK